MKRYTRPKGQWTQVRGGRGSPAPVAAICNVPVQLYGEELAGLYDVGDVLEGEKGRLALELYPMYFAPRRKEEG